MKPPRKVRDILPIAKLWEDGTILGTDGRYSRTWELTDINYEALDTAERERALLNWCAFLNVLEPDAINKVTLMVRRRRRSDIVGGVLAEEKGDGLDIYRREINSLIVDNSTDELSMQRRIYFTAAVSAQDYDTARRRFARIDGTIPSVLMPLNCRVTQLRGVERLELLHEAFRLGDKSGDTLSELNWKNEMMSGTDLRDVICPNGVTVQSNHLVLGTRYARCCFIERYPNSLHDDLLSKLSDTGQDMIVSVDLLPLPTEQAQKIVEKKLDGINANAAKYARRQAQNANWSASLPYQLEEQQRVLREFMDDLRERDQKIIHAGFTLVHFAETAEALESGADLIRTVFDVEGAKLSPLTFQQIQGLATALPFGVRQTDYLRTLTTESCAAFVPFRAPEVQDVGGIYCGRNALSRSPIVIDRFKLLNYNGWRFGVPGSGKSLGAKDEISKVILYTDDNVMICDPEGEYSDFVRALGGQVVRIAPKSKDHINALDLDDDYGDSDAVAEKSDYIMMLMSQIKGQILSSYEKSILDRCATQMYEQHRRGGALPRLPVLVDILREQPEPEAQNLALTAEMFVTGSLDVFAAETNVDTSARLISFDIRDVGSALKPVAIAVILDAFRNRVAKNNREGKRTWIYCDEYHVLLGVPAMATFLDESWRQYRKRGGAPCAITQNIQTVLKSPTSAAMLANSEYIVMHAQGYEDAALLAEVLHIPDTLVSRLTNADAGTGLMRVGKVILPFDNRIPNTSELYKLMTTKPGEWFGGGEQK